MLFVPSGLSYELLKITRELRCSSIVRVDFAHDNIQKHYPLARGNTAGSSNAVRHAFCCHAVSTSKKGKAGLQSGPGTAGALRALFQTHRRILPH